MTDTRDVRALAERIREFAANATPGPWSTDTDANDQQMILAVDADFWVALCPHQCLRSIEAQAEKNATYIAAASPEAVAAIIEWALAADTRAAEAERWSSEMEGRMDVMRAMLDRSEQQLTEALSADPLPCGCRHSDDCLAVQTPTDTGGPEMTDFYPPFESSCAKRHTLIAFHGDECPMCASDTRATEAERERDRAIALLDALPRSDRAEAITQTARVGHLLDTIDMERTGRKEAEQRIAELTAAIHAWAVAERAVQAAEDIDDGLALTEAVILAGGALLDIDAARTGETEAGHA